MKYELSKEKIDLVMAESDLPYDVEKLAEQVTIVNEEIKKINIEYEKLKELEEKFSNKLKFIEYGIEKYNKKIALTNKEKEIIIHSLAMTNIFKTKEEKEIVKDLIERLSKKEK